MKTTKVKNVECECQLKEKKEKVRKKNILKEVFNDYCSSTSLHGIGYLGAENKSFAEKVWWIIMFIISLFVCIYFITRTWIKWTNDPVILSFENEQIPIWDIPFPAVTICPVNKVRRTYYNYTKKFHNRNNLTEEEYKQFWDISLVCNLEQYSGQAAFNCTFNTTDDNAVHNILMITPSISNVLLTTRWQNREEDIAVVYQITEEGLCLTFNSFGQEDMYTEVVKTKHSFIMNKIVKDLVWSLESGYKHKIRQSDYPRRTTKDGITSGLSLMIHSVTADIDYVCGMPTSGYKVILHNPAEVPKPTQQFILISEGKTANIVVKPELTKTSKSLRSLPAETRKCYFSDEKSLKYFKVYTQSNCRIECNTNIILQYCDCVPFYLPREANTTICGFGRTACIREVERTILEIEMLDKGTNITEKDRERVKFTMEIYDKCHCLPSCNNLQYSAEISQSELHFIKSILATALYEPDHYYIDPEYSVYTQMDIFFKESQFYALKRSEIYGKVDFLANVGGLLGLFMGFSLLSLIEIIYFLTIRIWFMCKGSNTVC